MKDIWILILVKAYWHRRWDQKKKKKEGMTAQKKGQVEREIVIVSDLHRTLQQ